MLLRLQDVYLILNEIENSLKSSAFNCILNLKETLYFLYGVDYGQTLIIAI